MRTLVARRSIMSVLVLIVALASANSLQAQRISPVGARAASTHAATHASDTERRSATLGDATHAAARTGHSRQFHVVMGLLSGTAIGVAAGAVVGNQNAKRCHAEACQVEAALGGLGDTVEGGLLGAALGVVVGAAWPVHE
jgi:hypothetical protein